MIKCDLVLFVLGVVCSQTVKHLLFINIFLSLLGNFVAIANDYNDTPIKCRGSMLYCHSFNMLSVSS